MDLGNETAVDSGDIVLPDDPEQVNNAFHTQRHTHLSTRPLPHT